ncbi:hypothetical protein ACLMJK_009334 [Lecanora helva]
MAEAISSATGALQGSVQGVVNKGSEWLDSIFPPEKRNELMAKISKFATEKPMFASFIASQVALTGFPLGLFMVMTISVVIFALLAGLIIGLLGAVLFIVAAVGFALIILLPTLFFTTAAATFIWLWGLAGYYILKWFNQKEIPGIHKDVKSGVQDQMQETVDGIGGGRGAQYAQEEEGGKEGEKEKGSGSKEGKGMNGVTGNVGKSTGVDVGNPKEAADVGKHAGKASNAAKDTAGGVKGAAGGH